MKMQQSVSLVAVPSVPRKAKDIEDQKQLKAGGLYEKGHPFFARLNSGMAGMWAGK